MNNELPWPLPWPVSSSPRFPEVMSRRQKFKKEIRYQSGAFMISLLFALVMIGLYWLFNFYLKIWLNIPENINTIIVAAVALIILLPLRERLTRKWEQRVLHTNVRMESNMSFLLKLLSQHVHIDELIHSTFVSLLSRYKVRHAVFGVLTGNRRSYELFYLSNGKVKKVPRVNIAARDRFISTLQSQLIATGRLAGEVSVSGLRNRMLKQNSRYFISLPYRGRLIGFWALPGKIDLPENQQLLKLFAIKAALVIYNERLKPLADMDAAISQEFIVAQKIQSFLKASPIPVSDEFELQFYSASTSYIEFLDRHHFIYISNSSKYPSGILITSAIGLIYSARQLQKERMLSWIHSTIRHDFNDVEGIVFIEGRVKNEKGRHILQLEVIGGNTTVKGEDETIEFNTARSSRTITFKGNLSLECGSNQFMQIRPRK